MSEINDITGYARRLQQKAESFLEEDGSLSAETAVAMMWCLKARGVHIEMTPPTPISTKPDHVRLCRKIGIIAQQILSLRA